MQNPENMPHEFASTWNQKDPVALSELFSEDASFVNVVGLWWNTRKEIYKAHEYGLRVIFPESKVQVLKVRSRQIDESVAVVNARMLLTGQSGFQEIEQPGKRRNLFTFVMQRIDENWICVAAHNTDIIPGAETQVVDKDGKIGSADYRDNF